MIFRRRRLPEHLVPRLDAFRVVVVSIELGKDGLLRSVPGTRAPGLPLAETLSGFEEALREAQAGMEGWRAPELEQTWLDAERGLEEALAKAEELRLEAPEPQGFEGLIGLVDDLIAPLEAFRAAAERFRDLRA